MTASIYARTLRMAEIEQGYIQAEAAADSEETRLRKLAVSLQAQLRQARDTITELRQDAACARLSAQNGPGGYTGGNAALIAAAPDLLRLCKESLRWIAVVAADHSEDGTGVGQRASALHENISAVIARSEGRQP